jgi:hypothetical protein
MPGDPKECQRRAQQCLQKAERAASAKERQTFLRLHRSYNRLAVELEHAQTYWAASKAKELGDAMDAESLATRRRDAIDPPPSQ